MFIFQQELSRLMFYKNMTVGELWLDCAEKLTNIIQNIIEFAKLIPGFMRLSQDDQVCVPFFGGAGMGQMLLHIFNCVFDIIASALILIILCTTS